MASRTSMAAVRAVFETAELAEIVLTFLPFFDLVRIRRVSCRFNAVVKTSAALRRKLFLQASKSSQQWRLLNPNSSIDVVSFVSTSKEPCSNGHLYTPSRINPLLRQSTTFFKFGSQPSAKRARTCRGEILCPERALLEATRASIRSGQADSWHSMFLTNPPCKQVKFHAYWRIGGMHCLAIADVSNSQGVRLGELLQASLEETSEVYIRNESGVYSDRRPGKSVRDYIAGHGGVVSVELGGSSHMWVPGVICPRDDEWRTIEHL